MSRNEDGGPVHPSRIAGVHEMTGEVWQEDHFGISLRAYFAAHLPNTPIIPEGDGRALVGRSMPPPDDRLEWMTWWADVEATHRVLQADAMLRALAARATPAASSAPAKTDAAPSPWRPYADLEAAGDNRPGRIFVRVEGWKEHSGAVWKREHADLVWTRPDEPFFIDPEGLKRILKDGGMDGIDRITGWCPATVMLNSATPAQPDAVKAELVAALKQIAEMPVEHSVCLDVRMRSLARAALARAEQSA